MNCCSSHAGKKRAAIWISLSIAVALLCASVSRAAYVGSLLDLPPHDGYKTIENGNFVVIFPKEYEIEARRVLFYLGEAHAKLAKFLHYNRSDTTHVILTDNQDTANGVTSAIGIQGIVLYLKAPDPYTSIGEYDDWLRLLVFHEYTHFLVLDQTRGIFTAARFLFGSLLLPNEGWPTWLNEGLAVWVESHYTRQGRGYGTYYNTITRDALAHGALATDSFLGFDLINANPRPDFPFGEAAYYAGFGIVDEMTQEYGTASMGTLAEEGSYRIPYFLNGTLWNVSLDIPKPDAKTEWRDLWAAWADRERQRLAPELACHDSHASPKIENYSPVGDGALGARLSPDGKLLAYAVQSGHDEYALYVADTTTHQRRLVLYGLSNPGLSFSADGKKLYFSRDEYIGEYRVYSDLYEYDVTEDSSTRLSHGLRAKDPAFCGDTLIYSAQRGRVSSLGAFSLADASTRTLYTAPDFHNISTPRCTPDFKRVLFSEHGTSGLYMVKTVDARSGAPSRPTIGDGNTFSALFPEPTADGDVYFTRAQNGYYDLARYRAGKIDVLAHSTFGYWMPSVAQGRMAATLITYQGTRAATVDLKNIGANPNAPAVSATLKKEVAPPSTLATSTAPVSNYVFLKSLQPRIWSPYIQYDTEFQNYGASILGWDDTDQFEYTLTPWYDAYAERLMGTATTAQRIGTFDLDLGFSRKTTDTFTNANSQKFYAYDTTWSLELARPWNWTRFTLTPAFIAQWNRTAFAGDVIHQEFQPDKRIGVDLQANMLKTYAYSIGTEYGWYALLQTRKFFSTDSNNSPIQADKALAEYEQVLPVVPRHGALDLHVYAAAAPNENFNIPDSIVDVGNQGDATNLNLPLRGYPSQAFQAKRAFSFQSEYRLPLIQAFTSSDTFPLFTRNFGLAVFYDGAKAQELDQWRGYCDGAGAAAILNITALYQFPLSIRLEFAHGFQAQHLGQNMYSVFVSGL